MTLGHLTSDRKWRGKAFFCRLFGAAFIFLPLAAAVHADPSAPQGGQKYMIGVKGTYQETYVGNSGPSAGKSMRGRPDTNGFSTTGGSILFMSTPAAILSHLGYSAAVDFNVYSREQNGRTFSVSRADAGIGLYLTLDDLSQGNVGFYVAAIATGSALHLKGDFPAPSSTSLYQYYLTDQAAARAAGRSTVTDVLDRIDVLTLSRERQGRLTQNRKEAYFAYKAGLISRNQFMSLDIAYGQPNDLTGLLLQGATGGTTEDQHKHYAANLDTFKRKGDFTGIPVAVELGYMGSNFLVQYTADLAERFTAKGDVIFMERHTIKVGVFVKL